MGWRGEKITFNDLGGILQAMGHLVGISLCLTVAFQRRAGETMEIQRLKSSVQDAQPLSALRLGAFFSGTAQFICLFMVHPVVLSILGTKGGRSGLRRRERRER